MLRFNTYISNFYAYGQLGKVSICVKIMQSTVHSLEAKTTMMSGLRPYNMMVSMISISSDLD